MRKIEIDRGVLEKLYRFENKGPTEIAYLFGVTRETVHHRLKEYGIIRYFNDKNWLQEMHCEKLMTIRDMARLANCKEYTIGQKMRHFGIENITFNRARYKFQYNYFETIDSGEKAYWIGFILADGNIYEKDYVVSIKLQQRDEHHLHKFLKALKATNSVENDFTIIRNNLHISVRVRFCSKKMMTDLMNKKVLPRKSTREKLPIFPRKYTKDFLRGFFDGDGSFHYWESEGRLECSAGFVGSYEMMSYCKHIIEMIVEGDVEIRPDRRIFKVFVGRNKAVKFLKWLYEGKTMYLERKYNKLIEYLNLCRRYSPISDRKAESEAEMTSPVLMSNNMQKKPVRVFFMAYKNTMQETAISLIAKKLEVALLVEGDLPEGLAEYQVEGGSLLEEMSKALVEGRKCSGAETAWANFRKKELEANLGIGKKETIFTEGETKQITVGASRTSVIDNTVIKVTVMEGKRKKAATLTVQYGELDGVLQGKVAQFALF